ncbi:hypothetical protein M0805_002199 [Coniferiporia weirii]|nr:hypothetical protein M0805_002199 [Coniferiporia weirii]
MDSSNYQRSPYISVLDVLDPSSSPYADFNSPAAPGSPNSVLNQSAFNSSLPPTPFTPSYAGAHAGSYNNSPLEPDISHISGNEFQSPNPNTYSEANYGGFGGIDIDVFPPDEYDPTVYDAPDNSGFLFSGELMDSLSDIQQQHNSSPSLSTSSLGSNNPGVSVSVTPALDGPGSGMASGAYGQSFDHSSPASSNGDGDYQHQHMQQHNARSRASSVSSHGANDYPSSGTLGLERVRIGTVSPSPAWAKGPQSPPQLFIPTSAPEITHTSTSPLPSPTYSHRSLSADTSAPSMLPPGGIGSSGGRGLMAPDGPGIEIVPATPISAGNGRGAAQGGPFQHSLQSQAPSTVGPSLPGAQTQPWAQSSQMVHQHQHQNSSPSSLPRLPQAPPSQYTFPSTSAALTPPPTGGTTRSAGVDSSPHLGALQLGLEDGSRDENHDGNASANGNYLVPINQNPRSRSKSDTSAHPPIWQLGVGAFSGGSQGQDQSQGQGQLSNMYSLGNDQYSQQQQQQPPRLNAPHMPASFGPPITNSTGSADFNIGINNSSSSNDNFLSPDYAFGSGVGATDMRRARSESYGHRRNALSADMMPIYADAGNAVHPPSTHQVFLSRTSGTFLSPGMGSGVLGMGGGVGMVSSAGGAHRRSLSGGSNHGHGHTRSLSRERVSLSTSPYPSPHASPRTNANEPLPDLYSFPGSGQAGAGAGSAGSGSIPVHVMGVDAQGRTTVQSQAPIQVVRQNVTTHATADASQRRRRTEANFQCPVPGCGSTFTRHFNLKGHLRSHNEERPFKCKWPGCDKGFARQHDCKRHEQLHLNIRPYTCQGCQRTFARMDALNRHLRSDAGTECQSRQPILTNETPNNPAALSMQDDMTNDLLTLKTESDGGWQSTSHAGSVMV